TDGSLAFRVRLDDRGGNSNEIKFDRNLWVGIDAGLNGSVDALLGVATPSKNVILRIYDAGTGSNTFPNTTTITTLTTTYTYTASATNYNYQAVNSVADGGALNDLTTGGTDIDYYFSFQLSFSAIANDREHAAPLRPRYIQSPQSGPRR
ncbi:MAG: hypothetical protein ACRCXD_05605, partial [Luteolibacter sp.]